MSKFKTITLFKKSNRANHGIIHSFSTYDGKHLR